MVPIALEHLRAYFQLQRPKNLSTPNAPNMLKTTASNQDLLEYLKIFPRSKPEKKVRPDLGFRNAPR